MNETCVAFALALPGMVIRVLGSEGDRERETEGVGREATFGVLQLWPGNGLLSTS